MPPFGSPTISFHVHRVGALGEFDKILIQHLRIFHENIFMTLTYLLPTRSPRTARRGSFDTGRKSVCRLFPYIEGNRISKTNSTNRELYEWDYRNRLTSVTQQEFNAETQEWTTVQIVEYTYDYNNVWIRKTLDSNGDGTVDSKSIFIPENYQTTVQLDDTSLTDANAPAVSHHYLWTPNTQDKLLADTTPSDILWSLTDHLGSIRDIIQSTESGVITQAHIIYDAYGNVISCKNSEGQTVDNPLLFAYTGKAFDTSTQLQNNINRWYDATIGRWLSQDPIGFEGNDTNLYRYVGNMVHYTDSIGLKKCGPRVWLYTGSWCAENNVWEAAIEAAGNALLCWWKCEAEIHECVAGKLLLVTETISGSWSVITSRIPKRPEEIFNPKDIYKGAVRNIINKLGFKGSQAERIARAMVRGPWKPVAIVAKGVFATTMVVEAGFSISCGYKCGSGNEFSIRG